MLNLSKTQYMVFFSHEILKTPVYDYLFLAEMILLVFYVNNFFIAQKDEARTYIILGWSRKGVSTLILFEMLIVNVLAVILGLILSIIISPFITAFISTILQTDLASFCGLVFSWEVIQKTIFLFLIAFLIASVFNFIQLMRVMALPQNGKRFLGYKIKAIILSLTGIAVFFVLSNWFIKHILNGNTKIIQSAFLVNASVFLVFTLMYYILRNLSEKQIFHGLTLFNIKQLLLRITKQKSTFLTVAMLICCNTLLMLFCNILLEIRAEDKFIPEVDVSIYSKSNINILDYLNKHIDTQNTFESYAQGHLYTVPEAKISIPKLSEKYVPQFMKLSDYNEINTMQGKNHINLNNDKYLLIENIMCKYWTGDLNFVTEVQTFLQNNTEIEINSVKLFPFNIEQNIEMFDFQCARNNVRFTDYVVVIPDYVIADDCPCVSTFKAIYKDNKKEIEEQIVNSLFETYNGQANVTLYTNEKEQIITTTAKFFQENIKFSHVNMIYFMSYVGITGLIIALSIFVIMSILEIVQNTDNYKTLLKLGVPAKSVNSSVF